MRKSHHSLHGLLRRSLLRSVVCMILPVCVLAGLLVVLTQRYGADIALTTRASEVRTVLVNMLGDIIISVEKAIEQAGDYGHSVRREIAFLTVHGMLHLLGYDHIEEADRVEMRKEEDFVMEQLGISRD